MAGSTISTTTVEQNEVYDNDGHGIAAWSEAVNTARTNSITGLTIRDNHVHDHTEGAGIRVVSGLCEGDYNRIQATISGNTLSENGKKADTFADIEVSAALTDSDCTGTPTDTTNNHLDVTIEDNVSEDTFHVGIAVTGGVNESDTNTVTATIARNTVRRSTTAGIQVVGGANSSNSNTVTATLNDNLITRLTKLDSGNAGHGLALLAAAAEPSDTSSTSSDNSLTVTGAGQRNVH